MAESPTSSDYPGSLDSWVSITDKEDLAEASDINKLKNAVLAIQTELGLDPAGTFTDVLSRLALLQATNGALANGTSFPVSPAPIDGQAFYRTDEDVLYIYDGSAWDSQGQSLSNTIFSFALNAGGTANSFGVILNDSATAASTEIMLAYWAVDGTTYQSVIDSKFKKTAGISTITVYARVWEDGGNDGRILVDIGGQTGNTTFTENVPTWKNLSVDVSSLSDGTVYDISVQLKHDSASNMSYLDSIVGFGS